MGGRNMDGQWETYTEAAARRGVTSEAFGDGPFGPTGRASQAMTAERGSGYRTTCL